MTAGAPIPSEPPAGPARAVVEYWHQFATAYSHAGADPMWASIAHVTATILAAMNVPTADETTAAADRIDAYLEAWNNYLGHWASTSEFIAGGPDDEAPDLMRPDLLVVLAAARALATMTQATTCPVTAPSVFSNEPALTCVLPIEPAHDWHRAASGAKWSPNAQAAMAAPAAADDAEQPRACGRCRRPFDPDDRAFDGAAEDPGAPGFCRRCTDRCHESTDFAHECLICMPKPTAEAAPAYSVGGRAVDQESYEAWADEGRDSAAADHDRCDSEGDPV